MYGPDDTLSPALWLVALAPYPEGNCLTGTVAYQALFGVFLGLHPVHALLRIIDFAEAPDAVRFPALGEMVTGTILGHKEGSTQLIISQNPFSAPD